MLTDQPFLWCEILYHCKILEFFGHKFNNFAPKRKLKKLKELKKPSFSCTWFKTVAEKYKDVQFLFFSYFVNTPYLTKPAYGHLSPELHHKIEKRNTATDGQKPKTRAPKLDLNCSV
jgi:hypothetical protein